MVLKRQCRRTTHGECFLEPRAIKTTRALFSKQRRAEQRTRNVFQRIHCFSTQLCFFNARDPVGECIGVIQKIKGFVQERVYFV